MTMTLPAFSQTTVWEDSKFLAARARVLFKKGSFAQALRVAEKTADAVEKAEASKGKTRDETAAAMGYIAWCALFARRPRKALETTERALVLAPDTLWIETNRAHALLFLKQKTQAIDAYTDHKGETIPDQGKWEEVILRDFREFRARGIDDPQFKEVERALVEAPQSPEVLRETSLDLSDAGKYGEAFPFAERYAEAVKTRYGENHANWATALNDLAKLYEAVGRNSEAEALYRRALDTDERVLGKDHPDTLDIVSNLAKFYEVQGRLSEAEPLFIRDLVTSERVLGACLSNRRN